MLAKCPSCHTEYDCEPGGKYRCSCGAEFEVAPDGSSAPESPASPEDLDRTVAPRRAHVERDSNGTSAPEDLDRTVAPRRVHRAAPDAEFATMPGRRDRKPDGRFEAGDLILGRYKVLSELGQGGMGMVYECLDEIAGIKIALKALPPELAQSELEMEDVKENFQLVYNLHHPNIANYNTLEKDNSNGNYYLVMECVEGEDLRRRIKRMRREGSLTLENVLPVVRQVAAALDYAHGEKIVHRDIKPGNIMIDAEGHVKALDFGLAAQIHTSMTRVSMAYRGTSGTAPYMAPEQWRGKPQGAAADQYALAVMTYEMLAGRLPFESADVSVLREAVLNATPDPIPGIPARAQAAIRRAMSKVPGDRFGSCSEFAAALGGAGKAVEAKPTRETPPPTVPRFAPVAPARPTVPAEPAKPVRPVAPVAPVKPAAPSAAAPAGRDSKGKSSVKRNLVLAAVVLILLIAGIVILSSGGRESGDSGEARTKTVSSGAETGTAAQPIVKVDKTVVLSGNVTLGLIKVEAGTFEMSSKDGENVSDEVPHRVTLRRDFYLAKTEVTQAQWHAVMGTNPSEFKGDDLPVENVSWNDAMEFCEKLNSTGKAPQGWKFTLPTETQWEYAARGGRKSKGYKYSGSNTLDEVAWYYENSGDSRLDDSSCDAEKLDSNHCKTHPVGRKKANELGLYDMSGNVSEWCLDDWNSDSSKQKAEFTRGNDSDGLWRVDRGGSWNGLARGCRSARRGSLGPGLRIHFLGFRVALVPESY